MQRIDRSHEYPFPAGILSDAVNASLPQCGAKVDGRRIEGEVTVMTAHASVHLGSGGQYITCRIEPLSADSSRLHIESTYWQISPEDAEGLVERLLTETGRWLRPRVEDAAADEKVDGPRRCANCGVILAPSWKFCPMCAAPGGD